MKKILIILLIISIGVAAIAAAIIFYPYYRYQKKQFALSNKYENTDYKKLATIRGPVPTKLIIEKVDFNQNVIFAKGDLQSQMKALKSGPTHYGGTAYPGQKGNILIGGHYVWYTFKYLNRLKKGDVIKLSTASQDYVYKVKETRIVKEDTLNEVINYGEDKKKLLTLYTCEYPSRITKKRFLVISEQVSP